MPSGGALFGSSVTRGQSKNLVEFKAGKMNLKGKMVYPDKKKGLVYLYQSEDSLMHFCWKDRQSGSVVDDLIIFPDDCEFKRVTQCTTGRVYILKFKLSNRKFFFWLQEPKTDKDDENCRKVNEFLNNPPTPGSQRSDSSDRDGNIQNLLSNMSQQQLLQLFGGQMNQVAGLSSLLGTMSNRTSTTSRSSGGGNSTAVETGSRSSTNTTPKPASTTTTSGTTSTTTPAKASTPSAVSSATPVSSNSSDRIQLGDLQSLLSGLGATGGLPSAATAASANRDVDLSPAITPESLQAILANPAFVEELQQHLPSIGPDGSQEEQLRSTLASPQFQQAVSMFSAALQSGQLGPVVQQFGVSSDAVAATNQGNMEEFVRALQNASISKDSSHERPASETTQPEKRLKSDVTDESEKKKDGDDDVNME